MTQHAPEKIYTEEEAFDAVRLALDPIVAELRKAEQQRDELLADAMRYRFLRDPCSGADKLIHYCRGDYGKGMYSFTALDEILDEAIAKARGQQS